MAFTGNTFFVRIFEFIAALFKASTPEHPVYPHSCSFHVYVEGKKRLRHEINVLDNVED